MMIPAPVEIRRVGTRALRVRWDDGHESDYSNRYLRDHCPCAACHERSRSLPIVGASARDIYPAQIGVVGRYAVGIGWSDGHDSGIYSYKTLRELCPCGHCTAPTARNTQVK